MLAIVVVIHAADRVAFPALPLVNTYTNTEAASSRAYPSRAHPI
jgi:hypothetical protein